MRIPPLDPQASPLPPAQTAQFNALAAMLSPEQALWLAGYLHGVRQTQAAPAIATTPTSPSAATREGQSGDVITVLFASQTGNAMKVARDLAATASVRGLPAVAVSASDYRPSDLRNEKNLVLISSTQGEGDPPDAAAELHRFLFGKRAPALAGLRFAVLALGDYSYANFCKAGADLDQRLGELGAQRMLDRVDCDVEYQSAAEAWQENVIDVFGKLLGHGTTQASLTSQPAPGPATVPDQAWDKARPFSAQVIERVTLNGRGSGKKTVHLELSLAGSGISYQPGDALGVMPRNAPAYLEQFLIAARLASDAIVVVDGQERPLAQVLSEVFDITTITPPFLKAYAGHDKSNELHRLLEKGREAELRAYVGGRDLVDVLHAHPPSELPPQSWVGMLRRLQPRLYSIASSLRAHQDEAHLLVGLTRYLSHGRQREGVCSGFLCERLQEDEPLRVFPSPNPRFRLPADPDARIIMIGPGTGVAPFRAFVEEREVLGCRGRNWLFFGDQHFDTDFLYQLEWQRWHKSGVLSRLDLAFSRDQTEKIYVQHRMRERSRDLYAWLREGAYVYVCGDAEEMAAEVEATLIEVMAKEGGKAPEAAHEDLLALQASAHYQRDVY
jgi:sulfite reductase (NADPH) flavoprotein alpha-component